MSACGASPAYQPPRPQSWTQPHHSALLLARCARFPILDVLKAIHCAPRPRPPTQRCTAAELVNQVQVVKLKSLGQGDKWNEGQGAVVRGMPRQVAESPSKEGAMQGHGPPGRRFLASKLFR